MKPALRGATDLPRPLPRVGSINISQIFVDRAPMAWELEPPNGRVHRAGGDPGALGRWTVGAALLDDGKAYTAIVDTAAIRWSGPPPPMTNILPSDLAVAAALHMETVYRKATPAPKRPSPSRGGRPGRRPDATHGGVDINGNQPLNLPCRLTSRMPEGGAPLIT